MGFPIPIIGDLISGVKDLVSEVVVDKDKRIEINYKLQELEDRAQERLHEELMAQSEINKIEAASASIFVAGWRPFIGWVSGVGVAWTFILAPVAEWGSKLAGWTGTMPELETGQLMALVTAMLGMAGYRTFEKIKGVQTTSMIQTQTPTVTTTTVKVQGDPVGVTTPLQGTAKKKGGLIRKVGKLF